MEKKLSIAQAKSAFIPKRKLLCSNNMSIRVKERLIKVYVCMYVYLLCGIRQYNLGVEKITKLE